MKKKLIKTLWSIVAGSALAIGIATPLYAPNVSISSESINTSAYGTSDSFTSLTASPSTLNQIGETSELVANITGYVSSDTLTWVCESDAGNFVTLSDSDPSGNQGYINTLTYSSPISVQRMIYIRCTYNNGTYRRVGITLNPIQPSITVNVDKSLSYWNTNVATITVTGNETADLSRVAALTSTTEFSISTWENPEGAWESINATISLKSIGSASPGLWPITISSKDTNNTFAKQVVYINVTIGIITAKVSGSFPKGSPASNGLITIEGTNTNVNQLKNLTLGSWSLSDSWVVNGLTIKRTTTPATDNTITYEVTGKATYDTDLDLNFHENTDGLECVAKLTVGSTVPFGAIQNYFTYNAAGNQITGWATDTSKEDLKTLCESLNCHSIQIGSSKVNSVGSGVFMNFCAPLPAPKSQFIISEIDLSFINGDKAIGSDAFRNNPDLEYVKLSKLQCDAHRQFLGCKNLTLPTTGGLELITIGGTCFGGCERLTFDMLNNMYSRKFNKVISKEDPTGGIIWRAGKQNPVAGSLAAGELGDFSQYFNYNLNNHFTGCASISQVDLSNQGTAEWLSWTLKSNTIKADGTGEAEVHVSCLNGADKPTSISLPATFTGGTNWIPDTINGGYNATLKYNGSAPGIFQGNISNGKQVTAFHLAVTNTTTKAYSALLTHNTLKDDGTGSAEVLVYCLNGADKPVAYNAQKGLNHGLASANGTIYEDWTSAGPNAWKITLYYIGTIPNTPILNISNLVPTSPLPAGYIYTTVPITVAPTGDTIGSNGLLDCSSLQEVICPSSGLSTIRAGVFGNCYNLKSEIAIAAPNDASSPTLPCIGAKAFANCSKDTTNGLQITFPNDPNATGNIYKKLTGNLFSPIKPTAFAGCPEKGIFKARGAASDWTDFLAKAGAANIKFGPGEWTFVSWP